MKVVVLSVVIVAVLFVESNQRVGGAAVTDGRREVLAGDAVLSTRDETDVSSGDVAFSPPSARSLNPDVQVSDIMEKDARERRKNKNKKNKNKKKGRKNSSGSSSSSSSSESSESHESSDCTDSPEPTITAPLFYTKFNEQPPLVVVHGAEEIATENDVGYSFGGTENNQDYLEIPLLNDSCVFNNDCENGFTISSRVNIPHCASGNGILFYAAPEVNGCEEIDTPFPDDTWFRATMVYNKQQDTTNMYVNGAQVYTQATHFFGFNTAGGWAVQYQKASFVDSVFGDVYLTSLGFVYRVYFQFSTDDLMVWGEPLSAEDVAQISEQTVPYPGQITE